MPIRPPLAAVASALIAALMIAALVDGWTSRADAAGNCDTASAALDSAELEMLRLHNETRAANGLSPLVLSPGLSRMAAWKSEDSSASGPGFSHTDSLGRGPSVRSRDCGYPADAAENIAYGFADAAATFDVWMKSPGHKANILMSYYTMIGIGRDGDRWTVDFGLHDDSGSTAAFQAPALAPPSPTPTATPFVPTPVPPTPTPVVGTWLTSRGATLVTYEGPSMPVAEAVAALGDNLRFVYAFDADSGTWQRYAPGRPRYVNSLVYMNSGEEYFIGVHDGALWPW